MTETNTELKAEYKRWVARTNDPDLPFAEWDAAMGEAMRISGLLELAGEGEWLHEFLGDPA